MLKQESTNGTESSAEATLDSQIGIERVQTYKHPISRVLSGDRDVCNEWENIATELGMGGEIPNLSFMIVDENYTQLFHNLLDTWNSRVSAQATVENLLQTQTLATKADIKRKVYDAIKIHQVVEEETDTTRVGEFVGDVSIILGDNVNITRNWIPIAEAMGASVPNLRGRARQNNFRMLFFDMLQTWNCQVGSKATMGALIAILERHDIDCKDELYVCMQNAKERSDARTKSSALC